MSIFIKNNNIIWGVNILGQTVKEHDMLVCNEGTPEQHITHVMKIDDNWHREQDYINGKVINSYDLQKGTKIVIFSENKREVHTIVSNDSKIITTDSNIKIDAVNHIVLDSKEINYMNIAGYEDIKKAQVSIENFNPSQKEFYENIEPLNLGDIEINDWTELSSEHKAVLEFRMNELYEIRKMRISIYSHLNS